MISVVIPTYNSEKTIACCLDSIYASSYVPDEIIVVDDCSTDKTVSLVENYGCELIRRNTHNFQAACRNIGAYAARGRILLFIDSDIELGKDSIKQSLAAMKRTRAAAVVGIYDKRNYQGDIIGQYKNLYMLFNQNKSKPWIKWTNASFLLLKKDVFTEIGGFDESIEKSICEDLDLGVKLISAGYNIFLDKDIKIMHHKRLTAAGLVKMEYERAVSITNIKLKNLVSGRMIDWPVSMSFRITFLLMFMFFALLISGGLRMDKRSLFFFAGLFFLNSEFFYFLFTVKGFKFAVCSFFIFIFSVTVSLAGASAGIFKFIKGKAGSLIFKRRNEAFSKVS